MGANPSISIQELGVSVLDQFVPEIDTVREVVIRIRLHPEPKRPIPPKATSNNPR